MEPGGARSHSITQLRRGVLEYCVLAQLTKDELYGFELVRRLSSDGGDGLLTSEGTIYPLLSRLREQGWVSTTWRESDAGPPRRYYAITASGRTALAGFAQQWAQFRSSVDKLLCPHDPKGM